MSNSVVWIDIPAVDIDRAIKFYSGVFGEELSSAEMEFGKLGFLPMSDTGVGGCIFKAQEVKPSSEGILIYLNCDGRHEAAEAAVVPGGGKVLEPKHQIGPHGYRSLILDSEGNRIALHSH